MSNPHDKLIAAAARELLEPIGFRRKGRSRVWIADRGWWLNLVEFQPSGWAKGSYLNVAAHWLWVDQDYLSFDYSARVEGFVEYVSDIQFKPEAIRLAKAAAQEAQRLGQIFPTIEAAATVLAATECEIRKEAKGSWTAYHAGIAMGLSGRIEEAATLFHSIRDVRVRPIAARMAKLLNDPIAFRRAADDLIAAHRQTLGIA